MQVGADEIEHLLPGTSGFFSWPRCVRLDRGVRRLLQIAQIFKGDETDPTWGDLPGANNGDLWSQPIDVRTFDSHYWLWTLPFCSAPDQYLLQHVHHSVPWLGFPWHCNSV